MEGGIERASIPLPYKVRGLIPLSLTFRFIDEKHIPIEYLVILAKGF